MKLMLKFPSLGLLALRLGRLTGQAWLGAPYERSGVHT